MALARTPCPIPRAVVQALAPQRYRVQFTIGQETHDKLRRIQSLLRREIPSGDPGEIFERFLDLRLVTIEKAKLGATAPPARRKPETKDPAGAYEFRIRSGTDKPMHEQAPLPPVRSQPVTPRGPSRHVPNHVRRAVWQRDAGQPYAMDGPATVGNMSLRCRCHNQ